MIKQKSVFVIGNPGLVFRISAILMGLASERFDGTVNYCSFSPGSRSKRLIVRPFDWSIWFLHLFLCDIIFVAAASHHSRKGILAIKLGKLLKKKVIVDFYISHYEARVIDRKMYEPGSKEAKKLYEIERFALLKSTCATFLNNAEAKYFCGCLDIDAEQLNYATLPIANDHTCASADLPWHTGLADQPTFAWWGRSVDNPIHGLDKLIAQFSNSAKRGRLVLCVDGDRDRECLIRKYGSILESKNIEIRSDLCFSDNSLPGFLLREVDFAIGLLGNTKKTETVLPNKVLDAVFLGIPVYGIISEAMRELLGDELLEYYVAPTVNKENLKLVDFPKVDKDAFQKCCSRVSRGEMSLKNFGMNVRDIVDSLYFNTK